MKVVPIVIIFFRRVGNRENVLSYLRTKIAFNIGDGITLSIFQNVVKEGGRNNIFVGRIEANQRSDFNGVDDKGGKVIFASLAFVLAGGNFESEAGFGC